MENGEKAVVVAKAKIPKTMATTNVDKGREVEDAIKKQRMKDERLKEEERRGGEEDKTEMMQKQLGPNGREEEKEGEERKKRRKKEKRRKGNEKPAKINWWAHLIY